MEYKLNNLPRNASPEEIKQEVIRACSFIKSEIITRKEFSIYSKVSTSMLIRKFGSWKEVLESCGIGHRYGSRVVSPKMKNQFAEGVKNFV